MNPGISQEFFCYSSVVCPHVVKCNTFLESVPTNFGFILCSSEEPREKKAVGGMGDSLTSSKFLVFFFVCFIALKWFGTLEYKYTCIWF